MRSRTLIAHPFLFTLFPILSLYVANINQMQFQETLESLAMVCCSALLLWTCTYLWLHDWSASGILTSSSLLLFFSFAHVLFLVEVAGYWLNLHDLARWITKTRLGMLIWLGIEIIFLWLILRWVFKTKSRITSMNQFLNFFSFVLVVITLTSWFLPYFTSRSTDRAQNSPTPQALQESQNWTPSGLAPIEYALTLPASPPDIYYIILDGYGRSDKLQTIYGFDNHTLLDYLRSTGFYIADQAHSNYPQTALSLTSSLNFMYLDAFTDPNTTRPASVTRLVNLMEDNRTFRSLQAIGYKTVIFSNGLTFTGGKPDIRFAPSINLNSFQNVLINNSPLSIFLMYRQYDWHRQRILYAIKNAPEAAKIPGPKFVMLHIVAPHPPFVLDAQGKPIYPPRKFGIDDGSDFMVFGSRQEYLAGYTGQATFITHAIQAAIQQILTQSETPPIIILQGDHGSGSQFDYNNIEHDITQTDLSERFSILSAYYIPKTIPSALYPEITPVNSFRIIFNTCFGAQYPLLEDRSYLSPIKQIFNFTDVTAHLEK